MNSAGRKITERVRRRRRNVIDILLRGSPMSGFLSPVSTLRGSEHAPGREINVLSTPARILQITPRTMIFARATAFSCPRHARQGGTAPLMVTRERKGRPRGAVARLLLVLALCGSALAQAQSVFKCVIANPDGSRQTVFSATPCAAESEHLMVRASALSVRKVGRSDPGNEVAVLLASAERDIASGHAGDQLRKLFSILEQLEAAIEQGESAESGAPPKKLNLLPRDTADAIFAAALRACEEGAANICARMNLISQIEPDVDASRPRLN